MFVPPFGPHAAADVVTLRDARADEAAAIAGVIGAAFSGTPHGGRLEQRFVDALRADGQLAVSLVAERDDRIIGHVAFSPVAIGRAAIGPAGSSAAGSSAAGTHAGWYALAPLSVRPECRRQSIGAGLVRTGLDALRRLGARGCVVLGEPAYYARFGFDAAASLVFPSAPAPCLLALSFEEALPPAGEVRYHDAFYG
ncbi:putative acetyltransferase [Burkholderia multivorans]